MDKSHLKVIEKEMIPVNYTTNVHTAPGPCLLMTRDMKGNLAEVVGHVELIEWDHANFSPMLGRITWAPCFVPKEGQTVEVIGMKTEGYYQQLKAEKPAPQSIEELDGNHSPTHFVLSKHEDGQELVIGRAWAFHGEDIAMRLSFADFDDPVDCRLVFNNQ